MQASKKVIGIYMLSLFIVIVPTIGTSQILYNDVGLIPGSYQVEWHNAGLLNAPPVTADTVFSVNLQSGLTYDEKVDAALTNAKDYLQATNYQTKVILFGR